MGTLVEEGLVILQTLYLRTAKESASVCLTFCQGQPKAYPWGDNMLRPTLAGHSVSMGRQYDLPE